MGVINVVSLIPSFHTEFVSRNSAYIVTDLLKTFLGNGSVNMVSVQQWKVGLSVRMFLRVGRQQRTNEDAG
jgi:hypothetical protein